WRSRAIMSLMSSLTRRQADRTRLMSGISFFTAQRPEAVLFLDLVANFAQAKCAKQFQSWENCVRIIRHLGSGIVSEPLRRYVRQIPHRVSLMLRRQMRVLPADRCRVVTDNLACNEVGHTSCFQQCHRAVEPAVERNFADLP